MNTPASEPSSTKPERLKLPTAKWGAACAPCATAKAKCIRPNDTPGAKCERCERLLKECKDQIHRPRKKRQAKPSRTAQIEEKLDGLVSLLRVSGDLSNAELGPSSHGSINDDLGVRGETPFSSPSSSIPPVSNRGNAWAVASTYNSFVPKSCTCNPEGQEAPPPPDSDQGLLDFYREKMQPGHPFVIIPPDVTAATLKARRPFLMAAIRMVSSFRSLRSVRAQMYHLMKHIADYMLIRSEKSLELLLGIIVMLGYQQYHCWFHGQMHNLISLAVTLVGDIGIHRPPGHSERTRLLAGGPLDHVRRTNEEKRAFAGVWYWASILSMNFGRLELMRYNKYLHECIQHLEADAEYESDVTLVYLVRIQRLTERIAELNSKDKAVEEISSVPTAPVSAYVSAFQAELDHLRNSLPIHLKTDKTFRLFLDTARLRLYEPPVVDKALIFSLSKSLASMSIGSASPLDKLYQSSAALSSWFDTWLSIPIPSYYFHTTAIGSHLVYALTMLGRWARLATPITLNEDQASTPHDPSTNNPNVSVYNADISNPQRAPSIGKGKERESEPRMSSRSDPDSDPHLAAAMAVLRSQLQTQPSLVVDIREILSAIGNRFENASTTFQYFSTDSDKTTKNIWMTCALKVRVTQSKLERWSELVSASIESLGLGEKQDGAGMKAPEWHGATHFPQQQTCDGLDDMESFQESSCMDQDEQTDNMRASTEWTGDLFSGVDPSIWFDGDLDWGAIIINSMGSAGPMGSMGSMEK